MSNTLIERIRENLLYLPAAEANVAHYVLENLEQIPRLSVKELASASSTSVASVVRFARRIGTEGYTDFKIQLSAALVTTDITTGATNINANDTCKDIFDKVTSFAIESIRDTQYILDVDALAQAIFYLRDAAQHNRTVYIYGLGATSFLAEQAQFELTRLGLTVMYNKNLHLFLESLINTKADDVLLCLSTLGRSNDTYRVLQMASNLGARIILISQYGNKKFEAFDAVKLFTSNIECDRHLISATAHITESVIVHTLFFGVAVQDYDYYREHTKKIRRTFQDLGYIKKIN